ncbi:MAG: sigma-54 dependent transcriptional regulator [Gemmatimonadota bacterium]|nr:sigma-54 dependent transcriptional regulator [Gemmatimonadota bacterium]
MKSTPKILLVDDETGILDTLRILLTGEGYEVATATGGEDACRLLSEEPPDLVLTDIRMPGKTGIDVLRCARAADEALPVILMTAQASLQTAVRAVNEGAYYYLQKPFSNDEVLAICKRAVEARLLTTENHELKREIKRRDLRSSREPVGRSASFRRVVELARTVAPTESTVLISGESGTGKEVMARFLHDLSERGERGFFSINCGALPETLLESELFGHVEGSFTGAVKDKDGLLVAAGGGTLFLDEIGETSPATQVKLLRAIQEREVIPVGATRPVAIDVRILAATNRDLEEEVRRGSFRSDLFYRLNVFQIEMPPLRDRKTDIPLLIDHFLRRLGVHGESQPLEVHEDALQVLMEYPWPGNVRELENALERAAIVSLGDSISVEDLPARIREAPTPRVVCDAAPANPPMEVVERAYIQWVLNAEGGNKTRAADVLGIDPSTLYRKINRYGLAVGAGAGEGKNDG